MTPDLDGAALQRRWNQLCDQSAPTVADALAHAKDAGDTWAADFLSLQVSALHSLQALANGRRYVPGEIASGLLHDVPPQLQEAPYEPALTALGRVSDCWSNGLGAPDWDWKHRGYPPGWKSAPGSRLRAGLFYRAR